MTYPELYCRLGIETAIVTFLKKDGTIRNMLCTRNVNTASIQFGYVGNLLGAHDKRCNINNGNLAVIDLVIGESRSFSIDRVISTEFLGEITTKEQFDNAMATYINFKQQYEANMPKSLDMDTFDSANAQQSASAMPTGQDINNIFANGGL